MSPTIFNKQLFFRLVPVFTIAVIAGTMLHETGHYLAAKCMGFQAGIHYKFTHVESENEAMPMTPRQQFYFILAGPLQTMLTGTVALVVLFVAGRRAWPFTIVYWLLVFLSLLWVRQPADFCLAALQYIKTGHYPTTGDEAKLSLYFGWPAWSLHAVTAVMGLGIIAIILFRFIPLRQRLTFYLASSIGGLSGFLLWLVWLGKYILP